MKKILGVACVVLALAATACGGSKATPLETVRNAAAATSSADTAKLFMTVETADGNTPKATFEGAFDFEGRLAQFTLDASTLGIPGASGDIDAVMDFTESFTQYMKVPGMEAETGKEWLKIDIAATLKEVCPDIDFASLLSSQSGDPTAGLYNLTAAGTVTEQGTEAVRGVDTRHYRVKYDISKVGDNAPEELRDSFRDLEQFYTDPVQEIDVWIDDDDRVRRMRQTVDPSDMDMPPCLDAAAESGANPFQGVITVVTELYDFGEDVEIVVPPTADVYDLSDLMQSLSN